MNLVQWKSSFSLGIPSVDLEHREMIGLINEAYQRLEGREEPAAIEAMLGEIHAGIAAHFALEERLMRESGYGEYSAHKDDHERLLDQIMGLMDDYANDPQAGREQLQLGLSDWFSVHFASFDARLHGVLIHPAATAD
ncbi:MAG: hemerythrin family protein [Xanthomonadales bacterium]|nr:hemerythrin family protein [Xanthomonadales bacterium]